jgi:cytochrome c biogenesis protein
LSQMIDPSSETHKDTYRPVKKALQIFASLKLAIVLILVLVVLTLIGTFVIQMPAEYSADLQNYLWWMENVAQTQTGAWYPLFRLLGFFDLFHSIWFILTGLLLMINIVVCSLNRLNQVRSRLFLRPVVNDRTFFTEISGSIVIPNIKSADNLVFFLKKQRYKVAAIGKDDETHILAIKNRLSPLGTYLIHFSLILFILGFVVGHYWGFQNNSFVVAEGQTKDVGFETGLSLKLVTFRYESYEDGSPKNYTSQVVLIQDQETIETGKIEVNHPLKYQGVRFYQSFYGPAINLQILQNKTVIYQGMVPLDTVMNDSSYVRQAGYLNLSDRGYLIYLVAPAANIDDPALRSDQIGVEVFNNNRQEALASNVMDLNTPLASGDLEIVYTGNGFFSGFLVNSDPGAGFIWTGSGFLLVGLIMVFYLPRRRLQAAFIPNSEKVMELYLRWDNSCINSRDTRNLAEYLK